MSKKSETRQFVEVFGITSTDSLESYQRKLNSYLEQGARIIHLHSVFHPSWSGGEVLTTIVFEEDVYSYKSSIGAPKEQDS